LKSTNVLSDQHGTKKLSDFGTAWQHFRRRAWENPQAEDSEELPMAIMDSLHWMAPEVLARSSDITNAIDIWSLGCIVIEMLTSEPPWFKVARTPHEILALIQERQAPQMPSRITARCLDFLNKTMNPNPAHRPTAEELLEHPFIKDSQMTESNIRFLDNEFAFTGKLSLGPEPSPTPPAMGRTGHGRVFFGEQKSKEDYELPPLPSIKAIEVPLYGENLEVEAAEEARKETRGTYGGEPASGQHLQGSPHAVEPLPMVPAQIKQIATAKPVEQMQTQKAQQMQQRNCALSELQKFLAEQKKLASGELSMKEEES
jgi:serine/threonine protein kinase